MEEGYELGDVHCKTDIAVVELENPVDENLVGNDDFIPLYADAAQYAVGSGVEQIGYGAPQPAEKYYNTSFIVGMNSDPITWNAARTCFPSCDFTRFWLLPYNTGEGDSGGPILVSPEGRPMVAGVLHGTQAGWESCYTAVTGDNYFWILEKLGADYVRDADGDTVADSIDNCPVHVNPDQGIGDEDCGGAGDGRPALCDNCPDQCNHGQEDSDILDGELSPDQLGDACDTCPFQVNPGEDQLINSDGDDYPDACDYCPRQHPDEVGGLMWQDDRAESGNDRDRDGYGVLCDLCPYQNPTYLSYFSMR